MVMVISSSELVQRMPASGLPLGKSVQETVANTMPSLRQTQFGVTQPSIVHRSMEHQAGTRRYIASPRLAPSAVTAEYALNARISFSPEFKHHMLQTRINLTSNTLASLPRFRDQIDILA